MIKIITGWSNKGGSTFALMNLMKEFEKAGHECIMYGPHEWHLDKCNGAMLKDFVISEDDIIIAHFIQLPGGPKPKKVVLSCHEKDVFEVGNIRPFWDTVVFLNEKQRKYHKNYFGPYEIIPNTKVPFEKKPKSDEAKKTAGIIGSFDVNKQTHISIERAVNDGFEKVLLFGGVSDQEYYNEFVKPLVDKYDNVSEYGFIADKQEMYDMIGTAYLSSKSEVASLVKDECYSTGTEFKGNHATNNDTVEMTNEEVVEKWIKVLGL
jgi:hypothetical protein